jgi:hypothetical protein
VGSFPVVVGQVGVAEAESGEVDQGVGGALPTGARVTAGVLHRQWGEGSVQGGTWFGVEHPADRHHPGVGGDEGDPPVVILTLRGGFSVLIDAGDHPDLLAQLGQQARVMLTRPSPLTSTNVSNVCSMMG